MITIIYATQIIFFLSINLIVVVLIFLTMQLFLVISCPVSELSSKLAVLKGSKRTTEILSAAKVSYETFRKIERGQSVKLKTLRRIADALNVTDAEWLDMVVAWLKTEAGRDAQKLSIRPREGHSALHDAAVDKLARATDLFQQLNSQDAEEIIKAMQRPEVRACLVAINQVWEKMGPRHCSPVAEEI